MKVLTALTPDQVDKPTKKVFDSIHGKLGMLPNLYGAMGNSPALLRGLLAYENILRRGYFSAREIEAIALVVSEINRCDYSLAAHTSRGKAMGYSEKEIIDIRKGTVTDEKLRVLTVLTGELTRKKGRATRKVMDAFFLAGYSKQAFAELLGWLFIITTMNYLIRNGEFEIDFPRAPNLQSVGRPVYFYALR